MSADVLQIEHVVPPRTLGDVDARDFVDMIDVLNRGVEHDLGLDHLSWRPSEALPAWHDQTYVLRGGVIVRRAGEAVGALQWSASREPGATNLEFDLMTTPESRGHGIEPILLRRVVQTAHELGRTALQTFTVHRLRSAQAVVPSGIPSPTGFGEVPRDTWSESFLDHGFTLQQVERNSFFDLSGPFDDIRHMLEEAVARAGAEYHVHLWSGPTPERFREAFAYVLSRMSTDVPMSGLDVTEETWDVARVEARDKRLADSGLLIGVAAVEHLPTGRIVAYNELGIGEDRSRPTDQWGTLVTAEHRGRRLGMIVKCANLLRWAEEVPTSPFVSTFNAEENRPMLEVNEPIGFVPLTVAGAWQKRWD